MKQFTRHSLKWLQHGVCVIAAVLVTVIACEGMALAAARIAAAADDSAAPALTVNTVQGERDRLARRSSLREPIKSQILEHYDRAIETLREAEALAEDAQRLERERLAAPGQIELAKAEALQPAGTLPDTPEDASLEQLRQQRDQAEANLTLAQQRLNEIELRITARDARRTEIPALLARAQQDLQEITRLLQAPANQGSSDEPTELLHARHVELRARQLREQRRVAALQAELANLDAHQSLLEVQRETATRRVTQLERAAREWRDRVSRAETAAATAAAAAAARAAQAEQMPAVRAIAERNVQLLEQLSGKPPESTGLLARQAAAAEQLEQFAKLRQNIQERFERELRIGSNTDLMDVIDVRLRRIRAELPDVAAHRAALHARRIELTTIQQQLAEAEYELDALVDLEARVEEIVASLGSNVSPEVREEVAGRAREHLNRQQNLLLSLTQEYKDCAELLVSLQDAESRLVWLTSQFVSYIDERILWIRSMPAVGRSDFEKIVRDARFLSSTDDWMNLGRSLWLDARANPSIFSAWVIFFLMLVLAKPRLTAQLRILAGLVPQVYTDRFSHTVKALLVTVLLSMFWPAVLLFIAWRIRHFDDASAFGQAVAAGLSRSAVLLFTMYFHWQLCRSNGLGEAHFRWRDPVRRVLRRNLMWLMIIACPLAFVTAAAEATSNDPGTSPLSRAAFMAGMAACAVFAARVLRPQIGVLDPLLDRNQSRHGWLYGLRHVWYLAIVCIPLALLVTAARGYYYTAAQLENRLVTTFWLVLSLIVLNGLMVRWLMIARRRLAIEESRKRRAAQGDASGVAVTAETAANFDEPKLGLETIGAQTRQLLRSFVVFSFLISSWFIWVDMLPALAVLKRVEIWPHFATIHPPESLANQITVPAVEAPASSDAAPAEPRILIPGRMLSRNPAGLAAALTGSNSGAEPAAMSTERSMLTLSDLMLCIFITIVTILVAKNIPGLLEISILQRLPLEPSARYATSTLARYIIVIVGSVLAFGAIGIGWSKVQWLAAAITLGIGFGLQEIFANFISGIILLFEQPIRVGDTVTVNGMDGTVTRIRMRATTITDWDRKELIIPNKDFITGQILNWTLSDPINRLIFPISIAPGADTAIVEQKLHEVTTNHPLVLNDPKPQVVFTGFTDGAITYSVRVFIMGLENLLRVRHEINTGIEKALREAGIEIASPRRDIRIRPLLGELPLDGNGMSSAGKKQSELS